jgi:hypothetical protein
VRTVKNVIELRLDEIIRLDRDQLEVLYAQLGPAGADNLVAHAMEELAVELARLEKRHKAGQIEEVRKGARSLIAIAQQTGMTSLARVARDVLDLTGSNDSAAYAAATARLLRIGERSLVAVWDLQDISI